METGAERPQTPPRHVRRGGGDWNSGRLSGRPREICRYIPSGGGAIAPTHR